MKIITTVHDDDWMGLYIDDELKIDGDSISVSDVISILEEIYDFAYDVVYTNVAIGDRLPENLKDVKVID